MLKTLLAGIMALTAATGIAQDAISKDWLAKERFQIRGRLIQVNPDETSTSSLGGDVDARAGEAPEIDLTYFVTDHWALELIAATTKHKMDHSNPALDLGSVWILPPTLTAQYHFRPGKQIRPYVGAGLNYTFFYNEDTGAQNNITYENGIGYALQAGVDVGIDDHWFVNADLKKIYLETDAVVNYAVTAKVDLDPWVAGFGIGYRF